MNISNERGGESLGKVILGATELSAGSKKLERSLWGEEKIRPYR